jgi:lipopolysaccharide export LptBFGC system permease protein LptF
MLNDVTESGRVVVGVAALIGIGAAIGAVIAAVRGSNRQTGALLLLSAIIPTGFAYLPNVVAIVLGVALLRRRSRTDDKDNERTIN